MSEKELIDSQAKEIERLKLQLNNVELDKADLLQRLRFYRDRHTASDTKLIYRTIRFLSRFKGSQNNGIKTEAEELFNKWDAKKQNLSTIKKKDYVSKQNF